MNQSKRKQYINTLEEKKSLLIELSERMQLGQSLFVEVSDASLEENLLEESGLNLVAQFIIGWVNYLQQIGQVKPNPTGFLIKGFAYWLIAILFLVTSLTSIKNSIEQV